MSGNSERHPPLTFVNELKAKTTSEGVQMYSFSSQKLKTKRDGREAEFVAQVMGGSAEAAGDRCIQAWRETR